MEEIEDLGAAVYRLLELNFRQKVHGMFLLLEDGCLDAFDCLGVAPLLARSEHSEIQRDEYERKRLEWLERYEPDWRQIEEEEVTANENHVRNGRAGGRKRAAAFRQNQRSRRQDVHTRRNHGEIKK